MRPRSYRTDGMNRHALLIGIYFLVLNCAVRAQERPHADYDSTYYQVFPNSITGRFYFSQKYTNFDVRSTKTSHSISYVPNTTFNMGVGATYRNFTLNLAYGFGFLNPDRKRGKTRYLDLQLHLYPRKWAIDVFNQFYNGYYLTPRGNQAPDKDSYYLRPDLRVILMGASAFRVINDKRFSYRAALIQNEWQKKSAGSVLLGGELFFSHTIADSSFVPANLASRYHPRKVDELYFMEFGPGIGYAYTYVTPQRFFLSGSLTVNIGITFMNEVSSRNKLQQVSVDPNVLYRLVAGYSDGRWNANVSWVNSRVTANGSGTGNYYVFNIGNYRLTLARRFDASKVFKKDAGNNQP